MKISRLIRPVILVMAVCAAISLMMLSAWAAETDPNVSPASEHHYTVVGNRLVCDCDGTHEENGLVSVNGTGYLLKDGQLVAGWTQVDGDWYYFDDTTYASVATYFNGFVTFKFEESGKLVSGKWYHDTDGSRYFYGPSFYMGTKNVDKWFEIDGQKYCFDKNGFCYKGTTFVHDTEEEVYKWYAFGANGELIAEYNYTGPIWLNGALYYPVNGVNSYGMRMVDDAYYFFGTGNARAAVKSVTRYCSMNNDLLPVGTYTFGTDGKMLDKTFHIVDSTLYYFELGNISNAIDLCEINGLFYAVDEEGRVIYHGRYTDDNGDEYIFRKGVGEKVKKNGPQGDRFYVEDEVLPAYYGLVEYEGDFYYINDGGLIVRSKKVYVANTNGLVFSNGTEIPVGYYNFDADGKMIYTLIDKTLNGVIDGQFYVEGVPLKAYYGLVEYNGNFYLVDAGGYVVTDRKMYVSKTNGLKFPNGATIPNDYFEFDADGKMIYDLDDPSMNGLKGDRFYVQGLPLPAYYGLVEYNGDYYYVNDGGLIARNSKVYVSKTNGLKFPDGSDIPVQFFNFDGSGKMIYTLIDKTLNGIIDDRYYIEGVPVSAYYGLVEYEGAFYYVGADGLILKNGNTYVDKTNGLKFANGAVISKDFYDFDAEGKMIYDLDDPKYNGLIGDRYYIQGVPVKAYYGLVEHNGDFYYIDAGGVIVRSCKLYVSKTNGLIFSDGTEIPNAYFEFDADGKMIYTLIDKTLNGIIDDRYYIEGVPLPANYGLVEHEGSYYFIGEGGYIVKSSNIYVETTNGLKFENGATIRKINYDFDAEGKMVYDLDGPDFNGLIGDRYYIQGIPVKAYYGLVEHNGDFYYVEVGGLIVRSCKLYVSNTNGLKFSDGTDIPNAYFEFDADGKMIYTLIDKTLNGIIDDQYYVEGVPLPANYGLVEYEGSFYYIGEGGYIVKSANIYVEITNGLMFENGASVRKINYDFDADGKMIYDLDGPDFNGLIGDRYYIQGIPVKAYYGLVEHNGDFYYIEVGGVIVRSRRLHLSQTNGLKFSDGTDVPNAYFEFDADGKMIYTLIDKSLNGIIDDQYYVEGVPLPANYGLIEHDGNFYYIGADGRIVKNGSVYVEITNGLKLDNGAVIPNADFAFDADGKMIYDLDGPDFNGLIGDRYYIQGIPVKAYYGLVEHNGDFYYIDVGGVIVRNCRLYVATTNGLKFSNGTDIPMAYFVFDEDGKMILS